MGDLGEPHLGVTHGRRGITVDGAKIALPVYQRIAHGKILCHADYRVIYGHIAVRMIFTYDIAYNTRRLLVGLIIVVVEFIHGIEYASMDRLEPISDVRQGAAYDYAHRIIKIGLLQLIYYVTIFFRLGK